MKALKERDLQKHHGQLLGYWARMRPRYMVLCNFHEFWIYDTNDEQGQLEPKLKLPLAELPARSDALLFLRGEQPDLEARAERITADAAKRLGKLVRGLIEAAPELGQEQLHSLYQAARDFDWQDVHPEIFGSIFEQALDPVQRHELGAHFTRESDIAKVVRPTIVEPWRHRVEQLRHPKDAEALIEDLRAFHIIDPACGCGNFLYVAFREMKRIEAALSRKWTALQRKVAKRRADVKPPPPGPWFTVQQLHGIEIEGFAAFLARVVLWIGDHLANRELGLDESAIPLKSLESNILHQDALHTDWFRPEGELAIIGNPPYLGVRKLRRELGDEYVNTLYARYPKNRAADLVTYWFTQALDTLRPGERAGFVCTNSVAQNESREENLCFMGVTPGNSGFVLDNEQREAILSEDSSSAAVVRRYLIGRDVNREIDQRPTRWIIDFATMTKEEAEAFPGAMRHVRREVYPTQSKNRRESTRSGPHTNRRIGSQGLRRH